MLAVNAGLRCDPGVALVELRHLESRHPDHSAMRFLVNYVVTLRSDYPSRVLFQL